MRSTLRRRRLLLAPVAGAVHTACGGAGDLTLLSEAPLVVRPAAIAAPTALPPVRFPQDEGPHDVLAEWWYYTGHLREVETERDFGFELVFFRGVRGDRPPGYAAHFAVTDVRGGRFAYDQRQDVALRETPRPTAQHLGARPAGVVALPPAGGGFDLQLGTWSMQGVDGRDALRADMGGYALRLDLVARKPPALHLGAPPVQPGLVSFGPAGYSYYYSRTRMAAAGTLMVDGRTLQVVGDAWMDHQWGDFLVLGGGGWDWFALTLDDDRELTVSIIREERGSVIVAYGTIVGADGEARHLPPGSFTVDATGRWQSPRTRVSYPSGWRLAVPGERLDLSLVPLLPDQELDTRASTGVIYWEGVAGVRDMNGESVGRGYVELTGYK
ncbi:MAG: lipocalin family protein [Chloroflexota bacterium]